MIVLLLKTDLTYAVIAERVGVSLNTIQRLAAEHGLSRTHAEIAERDAEIMRQLAGGLSKEDVAAAAGVTVRTIWRVVERDQKRREAAA